MTFLNFVAIFIGGGLGSMARYFIGEISKTFFGAELPIGTFLANLMSCLVMALVVGGFIDKISANPFLKVMVLVGFCGGFSTFSTFSFQTLELFRSGQAAWAIGNIVVSIICCISILFMFTKSNV